ncbi:beta-lactamase-like protein [Phycomyces blakesleeanus]|uniref:Beta-lactamase-like protein n=1 Tax=Phycomyces blakesleeanus TaxID=4837 RepID=A0ABR3B1N4_PHYBL
MLSLQLRNLSKPTNKCLLRLSTSYFQRGFSSTTPSSTTVKPVEGPELREWLIHQQETDPFRKQLCLVDVRERHEIESVGKIPGALNIPFSVAKEHPELFNAVLSDLDKNKKTVFHCMSGRRSRSVGDIAVELGFKNVYNLEGGWKAADTIPHQPYAKNHSPWVHTIFEKETETAQYVVTDIETREAYIIDPVLDYDPFSSCVHPSTAKQIIEFVRKHKLNITKIIDTHVHADHLSAANYLKMHLDSKPEFWIGKNVTKVQDVFSKKYNFPKNDFRANGEQFDRLIDEGDTWTLGGNIQCDALFTPGHTPACVSYRIGDAGFVGDTLFMPDIGTARCDFPGGSVEDMYKSIHKIYDHWIDDTRIYVGHDYPPSDPGRDYDVMTTLDAHKRFNKMINTHVSFDKYVSMRKERDASLKAPRFIHPSLQTNLRGGTLPSREQPADENEDPASVGRFFKIPVRWKD